MAYYVSHGPESETAYPYTARDGTCKYNSASAWNIHTNSKTPAIKVAFDNLTEMHSALQ